MPKRKKRWRGTALEVNIAADGVLIIGGITQSEYKTTAAVPAAAAGAAIAAQTCTSATTTRATTAAAIATAATAFATASTSSTAATHRRAVTWNERVTEHLFSRIQGVCTCPEEGLSLGLSSTPACVAPSSTGHGSTTCSGCDQCRAEAMLSDRDAHSRRYPSTDWDTELPRVPPENRLKMLRAADALIDPAVRAIDDRLWKRRSLCFCNCVGGRCRPSTCECMLAGVGCHRDGRGCKCTRRKCRNTSEVGAYDYDEIGVAQFVAEKLACSTASLYSAQ